MTYKMTRIISLKIEKSNEWEKSTIKRSLESFFLTDEEFDFIKNLPQEYNYEDLKNKIYIDRHPSIIEEQISNQKFITDYINNLSDKFFVLYEYEKVE